MKEKQLGSIVVAIVFLVLLFGMSIGSILAKDREFSEVENRVLSKQPEFTMQSLLDGTYGEELEKYLSDQLIFKDTLVKVKNQVLLGTGRMKVGSVYFSKENMYIQEYVEDEDRLLQNADYIKEWCQENQMGIDHSFVMLVPNASEIYADHLPYGNLNQSEQASIEKLENVLQGSATCVAPLEILQEHKDEYIYYKTDHHWTMYGAYLGYTELAAAMKIPQVQLENMKLLDVEEPFLGSLYSQAPLLWTGSDHMTLYEYRDIKYTVSQLNIATGEEITTDSSYIVSSQLEKKDKYAALFGGNFGYLRIVNHTPDSHAKDRRLLIFKDSYANSMMPYLIGNYETIDIIDLRYFDYITNNLGTYGKDGGYDDVLFLYNISFLNSDKNFMGLEK